MLIIVGDGSGLSDNCDGSGLSDNCYSYSGRVVDMLGRHKRVVVEVAVDGRLVVAVGYDNNIDSIGSGEDGGIGGGGPLVDGWK
ncbi:hypothetical protein U1Q18_026928 [Sarracenia purpurea var. burkii]